MTGTSERARNVLRKSSPLPSGRTRSRISRSASALPRSASRKVPASAMPNPSRRNAKARLSRMAGSSSTTRTTDKACLLRRRAEGVRRMRPRQRCHAAALTRSSLRRTAPGGGGGILFRRASVLPPFGKGERKLVVARFDHAQAHRRPERLPERAEAALLDEQPLAVPRSRHEVGKLVVLLELPHAVPRVERLASPVHQVGADRLVRRALLVVLPEQVALGPVRRQRAPVEPTEEDREGDGERDDAADQDGAVLPRFLVRQRRAGHARAPSGTDRRASCRARERTAD